MRAALIPMKELSQAKMRLADVLDRSQRAELALAMLTDVIVACDASRCFDEIAVISNDSDVYWQVRELGARALAEPATLSGLNESLTFGQRYLSRRVAVDELVILPADVPLAGADDLREVVSRLESTATPLVVLVRSGDDGTNALALRPPEAIDMRFGRRSADQHRAAAASAGIQLVELTNERLAFDVDGPEDLLDLARRGAGAATSAWLEAHAHYATEQS